MRLNREIIIQRALNLVNKIGFEKLTTRRLGEELRVESPALYRHFKNKSDLVDHMSAAILMPVLIEPALNENWDEWLIKLGKNSLEAVMQYRDGSKMVAQSLPVEPYDLISKPLMKAGFSKNDAVYASKLFSSFMVGWLVREHSLLQRKIVGEPAYNHTKAFEFALNTVVDGLRLHLRNKNKGKANKSKR